MQCRRLALNAYACEGVEDNLFSSYLGSPQFIITSTGNGDSGLFETELRDERFLSFEGSGVISRCLAATDWRD